MSKSLREWLGVDRGPLALVFTDIVGSTEMAVSMGDRMWIDVLIRHFTKARQYAALNDGYEVKLIGDACVVAFRTADAALEFAIAFFNDTGHSSISIRAGIHVGDVRVIDNDVYGVMVNYTSRVQHAMRGTGIALSTPAKHRIEHELGGNVRARFAIKPLNHDGLKGFPADQQDLWQITEFAVNPDVSRLEKFDEYGHIDFNDEKARLDNFAIQLQRDTVIKGYIRAFAPFPGQAIRRSNRAKDYLVTTRRVDPDLLFIDGELNKDVKVELYIERLRA
jgi:class 3 adenylate cyclase